MMFLDAPPKIGLGEVLKEVLTEADFTAGHPEGFNALFRARSKSGSARTPFCGVQLDHHDHVNSDDRMHSFNLIASLE
ncbi:MAG: hypothetical protein ABJC62_04505 [Frankiaceae bacterium]